MFYYLFISINSVMCALITIDILLSIFRYSVQYFCAIFTYCIGHLTKFLYLITGYLLHLLHDNLHFPSSKFNAKMSISIIACETFKTHAYWSWAKLILNVISRKCEKNPKKGARKVGGSLHLTRNGTVNYLFPLHSYFALANAYFVARLKPSLQL